MLEGSTDKISVPASFFTLARCGVSHNSHQTLPNDILPTIRPPAPPSRIVNAPLTPLPYKKLTIHLPPADWEQDDTELPASNTHLWEESWDDDDTSEDFSAQLKEELKKVEAKRG